MSACRVGLRRGAALHLGTDAANDSFGNCMRGGEHREIHLKHGAECIMVPFSAVSRSGVA